MRVSYKWLLDYVDIPMSPHELASELERIGIETENIDYAGEGIESVVVGEILSHSPHPHASSLRVAKVNVGTETLTIVCGAPNLQSGAKGAVALPGTVLPEGTRVRAAEIRGILSQGMLLSEKELGISDDHSGIIILPSSLKLGSKVAPLYELDDHIFEFEITPNRPDLLSIIGIAREVSTITNGRLRLPKIRISESGDEIQSFISLEVRDSKACPRYMARVIKGVKVSKSPRWLAMRIRKCGLKEINNVVDVTNYVLLEFGHPLHSFDLDCVEDKKIVVRRAVEGERIVTLEGDEKALNNEVLLITDSEKPLAIAGIVGGASSGVTSPTTNVLLECAFFNPALIRRTSRILGIETEASIRFEKKADISILPQVLDRSVQLISRIAGGTISRGSLDFYPKPESALEISLRQKRLNRVLGLNLKKREISTCLRRLHIRTDKNSLEGSRGLIAHVPSFRRDLKEEVDLIEEVARVYGYGQIPSVRQWKGSFAGARNPRDEFISQLKRSLSGLGFTEVYSLSFVDLKEAESKGLAGGVRLVRLRNPLSEKWDGLRNSLLPSLMKVAETNLNRGKEWIRIFEVGRVFEDIGEAPKEEEHLAFLSTGERPFWDGTEDKTDFYSLKGDTESLLESMGVGEVRFVPAAYPFLHPGRAAEIHLDKKKIGILGELSLTHKSMRRLYAAELNLEILLRLASRDKHYHPISRFPVVERDLALLASEELPAQEVWRLIRREGGKYLESIALFDLYVGNGVPKGKKSLTYRMRFRAKDRTLRDEDVDRVINRILSSLQEELNVTLRGGLIGDTRV